MTNTVQDRRDLYKLKLKTIRWHRIRETRQSYKSFGPRNRRKWGVCTAIHGRRQEYFALTHSYIRNKVYADTGYML